MLYSHAWLEAFVPHGRAPDEIKALIGRHVATVDGMRLLRDDLRQIVIARVVHAARHPNAERLWVTKVDAGGGELLDVVCGAPVVTENSLYPFARAGTTMPGGLTIEKRKIRGETSNGMLCSARELGLGENHDGIMELSVDAAPGTPLLEAMPVGDVQFDVDVLPNRPDLLSHLGMARELCALTRTPLVALSNLPGRESDTPPHAAVVLPPPVRGQRQASSGGVTISIDDADGCPRYMGVVLRGVKVGPSPDWLVRRLAGVGARSITNVVDVTNYALHALGQPMHAFDLGKLSGGSVTIRRAFSGERLVTLDGIERTLDESMTVIADAGRAIAIAGVMGGRDSEVTADTTDILLESAWFTPRNVRLTRRKLGLNTDASYRFERGIDPDGTPSATAVAAELLVLVTGGTVDGSPIDIGTAPAARSAVTVRPGKVSRLLGADVSAADMDGMLTGIGFACEHSGDSLLVTPPGWRYDVSREADLVEEVARLRGFDQLSDELSAFRPGTVPDSPQFVVAMRVRDALVARGLSEVRPMPFVKGDDATHVRVANPLAEDEPHLRRGVLETLARRAEYNLTRMQGNIRLFEVGSAFSPGGGALPRETLQVGALVMGARRPEHFTEPHPPPFDEWDAKSLGADLAALIHPDGDAALVQDAESGGLWTIQVDGQSVGRIGRVSLDSPNWAAPAYGVEISLGVMANEDVAPADSRVSGQGVAVPLAARSPARTYRSLPTTPAAEFDLALLVPDGTSALECEKVLRQSAGELLERLELFDEFRGQGVPPGHRSLAWRLTFRDPKRTLRDREVEGRRAKILQNLERELGVRPRTA